MVPSGAALAKLEGRIFFADTDTKFDYYMLRHSILLGRSDPAHVLDEPLTPAQDGIDIGLGDSNKLSRTHARIQHDPSTRSFLLHCLGKNGLTVTAPKSGDTVIMTPDTAPVALQNRTLIQMGDSIFCFLLPLEYPSLPKKRREWIKAENASLRTLMMRLGYGRWDDIKRIAPGRLSEREPEELIPVARKFVARCYIHARPGVEQKVLGEILREHIPADTPEDEVKADVDALIQEAKDLAEPNEKRKFVRWARKLRLLRRLRDVHDHSSLELLRAGKLRVFTPRPATYWSTDDDVNLIVGCYRHGYGATEAIRSDKTLGFYNRYLPSVSSRRSTGQDKSQKPPTSLAGIVDEEDDHDDDDDHEEDDEDGGHEINGVASDSGKKVKKEEDMVAMSSPSVNGDGTAGGCENDTAAIVKVEVKNRTKKEPIDQPDNSREGANSSADSKNSDDEKMKDVEGNDEPASKHSEIPKDEMVVFPTSEALMKRLKSAINSCVKVYDRDMREQRKQTQAQNRAHQRKVDLALRKAEKAAEKMRQREERRLAKSQPFSKKDANEFEKALSNFGLEYKEDASSPDWQTFIENVPSLATKYHGTLDQAFSDFSKEAHRLVDLAAAKEDEDTERLEQLKLQSPSALFTQLTLDRAERVLDRLRFFRTLRSEVLTNPNMSDILRGCKRTRELPIWWRSTHDKALLCGVNKHGFNAWDALAHDPSLPFSNSINEHEEKNANDAKFLKKGAFPKASAATKRAKALVSYFRQRAEDPHYQQQIRRANGSYDAQNGLNGTGGKRESEHSGSESGEKGISDPVSMDISGEWDSDGGNKIQEANRPTILNIVDNNGMLLLPANLGNGLFLLELGEIVPYVESFHTEKALYPVGYRSVRQMSPQTYLCEIRKSDDGAYPLFRVSLLHDFQTHDDSRPMWGGCDLVSETPDIQKTWMAVANEQLLSNGNGIELASGAERFGLYEPTVIHYMQQLPGARECGNYEFRDFTGEDNTCGAEGEMGILAAMQHSLSKTRKRRSSSEEMEIPETWKKRRKADERGW